MLVRMLRDTDYAPQPDDSPRCVGQLRLRPGRKLVEIVAADGSKTVREEVGPMVWYFREGALPELPEEVAADFIAAGVAEPLPDADVAFVSTKEILDGMP